MTSLAWRIIGYLTAAQILGFVITEMASIALGLAGFSAFEGHGSSLEELASVRAIQFVVASLVRDDDGAVRIEPTAELRSESARNPRLRFAAFGAGRQALSGSAPELVPRLSSLIEVSPSHTHFVLQGDPPYYPQGLVEPRRTPFGQLHVAVYGPKFHWYDLYFVLVDNLEGSALLIGATILVSAGAAQFAVRQGLAPLRAIASDAERIDMSLLHQRLPVDGVPAEISPLVEAVNDSLERLAASAARMRRYTANAAHELRTPIAILRASIENLEEVPIKAVLLTDASRLQTILEQMLIATRLNERQATIDQEVDLVKTVREVILGYVHLAIECEKSIEFESTSPVVMTRGNQRAIESVIANLISNALRSEPPKGAVLVRVHDDALVEVVDHGEGITPSDRELIFEPFWRKDEATAGTGLGLAIAKELMEMLSGRIWAKERHGGGATFKVKFRTESNFPVAKSVSHEGARCSR
ncbi:two-component system, OmpR family, sensor histidine kinase TctE [freshwater sediment metagenome]|uniref:histidine kinase n=1 Tax=freshwater sediment metagenome TaxID=556182 RepID=A0AA48LZN0_9ZZZZ